MYTHDEFAEILTLCVKIINMHKICVKIFEKNLEKF